MTHSTRRVVLNTFAALAALAACALPADVAAQAYPDRTVRIIVPSPAGGPTDVGTRIIAERLAVEWGQPVIIENRPGANNIVGTVAAARAAPDGYTLLMALDSTLTMAPALYPKLPYNPAKDFAPVILAFRAPIILITDAVTGPKSLRELLQMAKDQPGKLTAGAGTLTSQLGVERLKSELGLDIRLIPYKGSAGTTLGLLTGDVTFTLDGVAAALPHIRSGRLRALANLAQQPVAALPGLPSFSGEAGLPKFDVTVFLGLMVPAGAPQAVIEKINRDVNRMLQIPEVREKLAGAGLEPGGGSPSEFQAYIQEQGAIWTRVVKTSGFKVE